MIPAKESISTIALLCQRFGIPKNSIPIPEASSDQESNAIGGEFVHKSEKKLESVLGVIESKEIEEELLIEEVEIDSFSRDSSITSEATSDEFVDELFVSSFLIAEDKDDSQITEIAKDEVNDVDSENHVQMKEVIYENLESLRVLLVIHIELN
ncbi:uncharacterized protein LOC113282952 isoform X2 [Papaver somniferum]|nr:uncharacterized protein LOC113282952 isoform X2 [Papaver somniferum]